MTLQFEVASLEGVDEAVKGLYAEVDGKFQLNIEGMPKADADGMRTALEASRREAKDIKGQISAFSSLGKSPEELQELVDNQASAEADEQLKRGQYDSLTQQLKSAHSEELKARDESDKKTQAIVHKHLRDATLAQALVENGAKPALAKLLAAQHADRVQVDLSGDDAVFNIVQADGTPMAGTNKDATANLGDLAAELRKSLPDAFVADFKGGGGRDPNTGRDNPGKTMSRSAFDELQKSNPAAAQQRMKDGWSLTD